MEKKCSEKLIDMASLYQRKGLSYIHVLPDKFIFKIDRYEFD